MTSASLSIELKSDLYLSADVGRLKGSSPLESFSPSAHTLQSSDSTLFPGDRALDSEDFSVLGSQISGLWIKVPKRIQNLESFEK